MSLVTTHTAIRSLYPTVTSILEDANGNFTCKDKDGNLVSINLNNVNTEFNRLDYKNKRVAEYPRLEDLADAMYWNSKGDSTKLEAYYAACEKVKTDNPKPS